MRKKPNKCEGGVNNETRRKGVKWRRDEENNTWMRACIEQIVSSKKFAMAGSYATGSALAVIPSLKADGGQRFNWWQRAKLPCRLLRFTLTISGNIGWDCWDSGPNTRIGARELTLERPVAIVIIGGFVAISWRQLTIVVFVYMWRTIGYGYASRRGLIEKSVFFFDELCLILATYPAITPITHQKLEAKGINLHAWLETDAQIPKVHLVLIGTR